MSLKQVVLLVFLLATCAGHSAATESALVGAHAVPCDQNDAPTKRFLRVAATHTDTNDAESDGEREIGVVQILSTAARAMKAKAKWVIVLNRGFGPAKAMKKLKVKNLKDKEFRRFARYYARYRARNPKKAASLPATAEDAAMGVKMDQWLVERVAPPQIEAKLQEFKQTNIRKYAEEYMKMWGANQVKLSNNVK